MKKHTYLVHFIGFGMQGSRYEESISVSIAHDWNEDPNEAAHVFYVLQTEIRKYFSRFEIQKVEKLPYKRF